MNMKKLSTLAVDIAVIYIMGRFIQRAQSKVSVIIYSVIIVLALIRLIKDWKR